MKILLCVSLACLTVSSSGKAPAETTPQTAAANTAGPQQIDLLIRDLSNESFRVRENASRDLWLMGETALPALKKALSSTDPEQASRARDLIRKIQLQITPQTDPEVSALAARYAKASTNEKITLFANLREKSAWRQMLKLYASETRAEAREKLEPEVRGIALKAARESLSLGKTQEARELLECAPANTSGLLALAEFHRSHGTLDAELLRARSVKGRKSQAWQLALERTAGNLEAARETAMAIDEPRIAAAMAALAGDPLPWVRDPRWDAKPVLASYAKVASRHWLGESTRPADLEPITRKLDSPNLSERLMAMNALFLLGEPDAAEATLAKTQALVAFRYFDALERTPEALKALGLDPEQPDYPSWIKKHLEKIPADEIEDQHEPSTQHEELVALASFLECKGLHDVALAAFSDPMTALAKKDSNAFLDVLGILFGKRDSLGGAPLLAKRLGLAWAGQDETRWDELIAAAFGEDSPTKDWWDWLPDLDPKASRSERLDAMLALFSIEPDPSHLREKWLALAWKDVAAADPEKRPVRVARISSLSLTAGDVTNSLKAWDLLPETDRKEIFWGEHILHLSAAERWNEAAEVFIKQIALAKEANQEPSVQFHAYAAAALRLAGRLDEAATYDTWVNTLALANPITAIQIGNGYAFGRDYTRAAEWWARAVRQADPDSTEFSIALKLHSDVLLEQGKWKECAATAEALAATMYGASGNRGASPMPLRHLRLQSDMARAFSILKSDRPAAIALLENCYHSSVSDGTLADFFFPALRKAGLIEQHDTWFRQSWDLMQQTLATYPLSDNTRNTAAWFAARAIRNLDQAEQSLTQALAANPNQSAYLDTMAELQFAKGHREKALEWSRKAVNSQPGESQLRRQQERFRSDPLPK